MRRATMLAMLASMAAAPLLAQGCSSEGDLRPLAVETEESSSGDPTATTTTTGGGPTPSIKRTVYQRNPFGNVEAVDNLLWDGDFEWRPTFASQYGWFASPSAQFVSLDFPTLEMGGNCRSGIKCAKVNNNGSLLGLGVAYEGTQLMVSVWVHTAGAPCEGMEVVLWSQSFNEPDVEVLPSGAPDEDGWCHIEGTADERTTAQYLYIHNTTGGDVFVDDVAVQPVPDLQKQVGSGNTIEVPKAKHAWIRDWARAATRPNIKPPGEVQRRLKAELKKWRLR